MIKTTVVSYKNEKAMKRDINSRERQGFTVMSVTRNGQGWGVAKTVVLGAIFLPLAIFGKKGDVFQVTYQKDYAVTQTQTTRPPLWLALTVMGLISFVVLLMVLLPLLPPVR